VRRIAGFDLSYDLQAQQSYEAQISSLTSTIASLEVEIDRARSERTTLQADLSSVRELNAKLDSGKEHVARQLSTKNVEFEQVSEQLFLILSIVGSLLGKRIAVCTRLRLLWRKH